MDFYQRKFPDRGSVWALAEDHVNKSLLFAGTEFGVFFTNDGGHKWIQLKGNLHDNSNSRHRNTKT